jgi:hypothetical protein
MGSGDAAAWRCREWTYLLGRTTRQPVKLHASTDHREE